MKKIFLAILILIIAYVSFYFFEIVKNNIQYKSLSASSGDVNNQNTTVQSHPTYSLRLLSNTTNLKPNQQTKLRFIIENESGNTIKNFVPDKTELVHFFVIRQDLQGFQRLQTDFNKNTGEFSVDTAFPSEGKYRLYADFTPVKVQQAPNLGVVTAIDIKVGDITIYTPTKISPSFNNVKNTDGYSVYYKFPSNIKVNTPVSFILYIEKDHIPVTDLEDYIGAKAQGIIFEADNLQFEHIHALDLTNETQIEEQQQSIQITSGNGPDILFTYTFPKAGLYKIFTQFQHQGKIITSDYTLRVD